MPINNLYETVERPVLQSIVKQLIDITQVSHKTTIRYSDAENKDQQKRSAFDDISKSQNNWPYDEKVTIEVDEETNKDRILGTTVHQQNQIPIFIDESLKLILKPVYNNVKATISFKYRASDRNQAIKWRNELRVRTGMLRDIFLHEVNYHYHIREEIIDQIYHAHSLREKVAGYGESFQEYFANNLIDRASIKTDQAGNAAVWTVNERQVRVQGYFDFEGEPEKGSRESPSDVWTIAVNYIFSYDKPIHLSLQYPFVVHNQLIDEKYRTFINFYDYSVQPVQYNMHNLTLRQFQSDRIADMTKLSNGVSIPEFDDFIPSKVLHSTIRIFTALSAFEPDNKRSLFNLTDLGDFSIDPVILDFIKTSEYPFIQKDFNSIFHLGFYRDSSRLRDDHIEVLPDLSIQTNYDINLRKTYRVRMGIVTDLKYLTTAALSRLQAYQLRYMLGECEKNAILKFNGVVDTCLANKLRYYASIGVLSSISVEKFISSADIFEFTAYLLTTYTALLSARIINSNTLDEVRTLGVIRKFTIKAINQLRDLNDNVEDLKPYVSDFISSKDCRKLCLRLLELIIYRTSLSCKITEYIDEALRTLGNHPDIKTNRLDEFDRKILTVNLEASFGRHQRIKLYQFQSIIAKNFSQLEN